MPFSLFISMVIAATPAADVAATLTEVTAVAAAGVDGAEVVSTRDIEKIVALESQKQLMGCSASDCLAEVAGALGARLVVFGELGALDDQLVLTLNLYDADAARSVARQLVQGPSAAAVGEGIPAAAHALLEPHIAGMTTRPVRVLVMNIAGTSTIDPSAPQTGSMLSPIGLVTVGVGGALGIAGGIVGLMAIDSDARATAVDATQRDAKAAYDDRDGQGFVANVLLGSAAVVAGAGAAIFLLGME